MTKATNPHFDKTVRASFAAQRFMATIGAQLERVAAEASMIAANAETVVATMLATMMTIREP